MCRATGHAGSKTMAVVGRNPNQSLRWISTTAAAGDGISQSARSTASYPAPQSDPFLIEVNVRPPGTGGTWSTLYTYGVDLGALQLLRAVNDRDRFRALSSPSLFPGGHHPGDGGGAQYWNAHCMIPVHRDWVRVPGDFFEQVYEAIPKIVPHVSRAELSVAPGTLFSSAGEVPWIGYPLMHSRVSQRHLLEMHARFAGGCRVVLDATSGDDLVS
ncbi:hypothetical protein IFM46972_10345 [Aspergillus udagawae]|uniref:ATP-grasp domain-containing protein n=1 Tax=Aspergillus udagawae TaxID=91492 RepID=A0A8H3SBN9_9EURO|nr:hypothetical protein IFM46972_10345 [Aspergillus udagawae]